MPHHGRHQRTRPVDRRHGRNPDVAIGGRLVLRRVRTTGSRAGWLNRHHSRAELGGLTYGDLHIYENHMEQIKEQLTREPLPLPTLWLNPDVKSIDGFTMDDIKLENYQCHPAIHGDMAV